MTLDVAVVDEFCRETFPARSDTASYEYVSAEVRRPSWGARTKECLILTVRLVLWDKLPNGDLSISDVKEQEVVFAGADEDLARLQAYLAAFVDVLSRAFTSTDNDTWQTTMPHDFVHADVLTLKTAHTKDDFVKAFERRGRLGRWLAQGSASSSSSSSSSSELPPEGAVIAPPAPVDEDKAL